MRNLVLAILATWLFSTHALAADEMRPVAIFSCASVEKMEAGTKLLADVSGNASLVPLLDKFLAGKTSLESLDGIDKSRPVGAAIGSDGLRVVPLAMVPVSDGPQFMQSLQSAVGEVNLIREGFWKIGRRDLTGYVRQHDNWLYIAQTEENLDWSPDPLKILGEHSKKYDLSLEFNLQHVPDEFRTMAIDMLRLGMRQRLARRPDESEAAHSLRYKLGSWQFSALEQLFTESGRITVGTRLDKEAKLAQFDVFVQPLPKSALADRVATLKENGSRFVLGDDDAVLRGHATLLLNADQRARVTEEFRITGPIVDAILAESDWFSSTEDRQVFQGLAGTLLEVVQSTVETGRVDVGFAVNGPNPPAKAMTPVTLLAAVHLGEGAPLNGMFEKLSALGKQNKRFAGFQSDVGKVGAHRLHAITFANGDSTTLKKLLGDEPKLLVAFTRDAMWMAVGPEAKAVLESHLASPMDTVATKADAPIELTLRLRKLADVATQAIVNEQIDSGLTLIKGQLRQADDRVRFSVAAMDDQLHVQIVGHEGVLKLGAFGLGLQLLLGR